jgi:hypothetical protein
MVPFRLFHIVQKRLRKDEMKSHVPFRLFQFVEERWNGIDVLAVRDHFALEFDAGFGAQLSFEIEAEHFLALGAVADAHSHFVSVDTDQETIG